MVRLGDAVQERKMGLVAEVPVADVLSHRRRRWGAAEIFPANRLGNAEAWMPAS